MIYAGNTEIIRKHFHDHQENFCVLLCFQSFLCTKHFFNEGYFHSRSFQKYSRTSVENSRTFQEHDAFSRTFQGTANHATASCFMILQYRDGETETKTILGNLKIPKLEEIFIRVAMVCHCYERLAVLKIFV